MPMKSNKMVICLCLSAILGHPFLCAEGQQAGRGETATNQQKRQKEGFVDYTLKRVNPNDTNYGQCIDDGRRLLLTETIESGYFWSNALTLTLLGGFFLVILFQRGAMRRRALICAETLCQYQSALARAEAQAGDAIRRNHDFMAALRLATGPALRHSYRDPNAAPEVTPTAPQNSAAREKKSTGRSAPSSSTAPSAQAKADHTAPTKATEERQGSAIAQPEAGPVVPGLDLVAQNNALQQQLLLTQDQVKQLRRQLNESERQLQTEKQKNRNLKSE
jgi:hypothetical protein